MFVAYFFEGLIVGSLLGLVLRPVLDSYLLWRRAKEYAREDAVMERLRVEIARTPFDAPAPEHNGHGPQRIDMDDEGKSISNR